MICVVLKCSGVLRPEALDCDGFCGFRNDLTLCLNEDDIWVDIVTGLLCGVALLLSTDVYVI
jgi:hypothetical protein